MPKLSKIRICGSKYEGFNKRHENSIFDLSPGEEGDHSLFTLKNGNGKGVMLQLIFQIILPGTSWGSNYGNKLEGMFYDRYNVFKPYTFHVVLEWNLDTPNDSKKKLITGICVSAHRQKDTDDVEGKVGLKYFLYTHEYKGESRLENLPIYSKSSGGVIDYDQMESFVDDNLYFRKYYKSSVQSLNSDYYQYLASHGIYRSEWEIMKMINRSEGGLENYFSRAKDNQALFDKMIIPAVSESISTRSGENSKSLLSMFADNIKIAKNLPELISRTEDINKLLQLVIPLLTDSEHGMKLKKSRDMSRERGNNYLRALLTRQSFLDNELRRSKEEKEKTNNTILELKYQEDNLKYARKIRELNLLEADKGEYEKQIELSWKKLSELEDERSGLQLNQHYLLYQGYQKEYNYNKKRIQHLKEVAGLSNIRDEIVKCRENIIKSWPNLKARLEDNSREIVAYKNYLISEEKRLKQEEENLSENIRDKELIIARYQDRLAGLAKREEELSIKFNPLQLSTPSYLLEDISAKLADESSKIKKLTGQLEENNREIEIVRGEITDLQIDLVHQKDKCQELEGVYEERETEEEKIRMELVKLLELDRYKTVYNQDWLKEKRIALKTSLKEKLNKQHDLNNKRYELELDISLNDRNFWIANYDQKRLYQAIKNMDIKVYYGSDFLLNLTDRGENLIQEFPLLLYGLVLMYEADWEQIKKNLAEDELLHAAVPIYINHQLGKSGGEEAFKLVSGREKSFVFSADLYQKWLDNLSNQQKEINKTYDTIDKKIEHIRRIDYTAETLLQKDSSSEIADKLSILREKRDKVAIEHTEKEKRQEKLQKERDRLEKSLFSSQEKKDRLERDYQEIKDFAEETKKLEEEKTEIKLIKDKLSVLKKNLARNRDNKNINIELKVKIENQHQNWLKDIKRFLLELSDIISDINFKSINFEEMNKDKEQQNYPLIYDYRDSRVNYYYQSMLDLESEEEKKSAEIKYLREKQNDLKDKIHELEEKLNGINTDWREYPYSHDNQEEIEVALEFVNNQLTKMGEEIKVLDNKSHELIGNIKSIKKQIDELYKEIRDNYNKTARSWPEINLNEKELEIKRSIEDNTRYLQQLEDMLEKYRDKINGLNNLVNKMELYQLDADKGEINKKIEEQVKDNPDELVETWISSYQELNQKLKELKEKTDDDFYSFKRDINELIKNSILKIKIKEKIIEDFRSDNFEFNYEMLNSFREYLHNELNRLDDNKAEAEMARNQWAERSAMHLMRIITSLKEMVNNMVYHNQRGYPFPLVRLRRSDFLPELEEEIVPELKEYFVEVISRFNQDEISIDRLTETELLKYTGDAALFSRAVRGRYPLLQVYKMTEKNEFQYAKPEDYFYADWEAVIQGKGDTPEASGGQSLSINAFMMMMLLNYKKQRLDRTNPWTVLFLDNPFGKASADHVLDPVFEIANKLNFQIVAFAAPEIIKSEISERFPVFYPLEISTDDKGRGVVSVSGQVIYGERVRKTW